MGDGRLECLTITQLAPSSAQLVCQMPERLPPSLTQLQTPLPGQTARSGSVACTLAASHSRYLAGLARLLPQLRSLRVLGSMEGDTDVLPGFQALTELQVCVGGLFRCMHAAHASGLVVDCASSVHVRLASMCAWQACVRVMHRPSTPLPPC